MSLAVQEGRFRELVNHPLSPAPMVVVCVGYWMPLEWMIRGESMLGNSTWEASVHVIATSALMNFFPAALLAATSAYVFAALFSLLFRIPFRQTAKHFLEFLTCLSVLASTARALILIIRGSFSIP